MGILAGVLAVVIPLVVFVYVAGFMFIQGSVPKGRKHDKWINDTCAPEGLLKSVLTWGYLKASFKKFRDFYRLRLFPQPTATTGKPAVDATVVDMNGKEKSLLNDYILKMPKGMPLILNMGSYT
jgi:hypothetical protein